MKLWPVPKCLVGQASDYEIRFSVRFVEAENWFKPPMNNIGLTKAVTQYVLVESV